MYLVGLAILANKIVLWKIIAHACALQAIARILMLNRSGRETDKFHFLLQNLFSNWTAAWGSDFSALSLNVQTVILF